MKAMPERGAIMHTSHNPPSAILAALKPISDLESRVVVGDVVDVGLWMSPMFVCRRHSDRL